MSNIQPENDWPNSIEKPCLPVGYEWLCLRPALGLELKNGGHPWWIRILWTMKNGRKRHLKIYPEYFPTAQKAIETAALLAKNHSKRIQP